MKIRKNKGTAAFTLMETLIVIGIIGILSAAAYITLNPQEEARGSACSQILRAIYTATTSASSAGLWTKAADIDDTQVTARLNGVTPGTKPVNCQGGGTYTWGSSVGWSSSSGQPKKAICSMGPPTGYTKGSTTMNATFPSALHNIRSDSTE